MRVKWLLSLLSRLIFLNGVTWLAGARFSARLLLSRQQFEGVSAIRYESSVLSRLLKVFPRHRFEVLIAVHAGDHRARNLRCWDRFVALLYGELTGCESLRELESGCTEGYLYL